MEAFTYLKSGMAHVPIEVNAEMILASGDVGIRVLTELCQKDDGKKGGKVMPVDSAISIAIPILKGN